jgi:toxin ParE1/3/4
MPHILRTRESQVDYEEIWGYIAPNDLGAADRLVDRFDETLKVIASSPEMGRKVEELGSNLRCFPVGSYLIFYRPIEDGIQLIRIVHGSRDITPDYFDEE